jgi:hypothetical protein
LFSFTITYEVLNQNLEDSKWIKLKLKQT